MNWTKTPPTKPGAYWWREINGPPYLAKVEEASFGLAAVLAGCWPLLKPLSEFDHGEWCGPLVPVEEVFSAYREGYSDGADRNDNRNFLMSRARRIFEGEQA